MFHNLTDITTYLHDCSDINASHIIIRHNIPNTKLYKTNMLADTRGRRGGGQFNNRLKPYSVISWRKQTAEGCWSSLSFSEFISLFLFFFRLHQIEQTYIGTCKVNTLWCFSLPSKSNWTKTGYLFLYSKHENTLKYLQKKYTYNAHHS